jgi:hypothetical protein
VWAVAELAGQVSVDFDEACLSRCTTTVVDAGTASHGW